MEKVLIFFVVRLVVILFGCQESVGKLKKKKFSQYFLPVQLAHRVSVQFFYIKKHMLFGNLIMI